jgi:hypothetical protein
VRSLVGDAADGAESGKRLNQKGSCTHTAVGESFTDCAKVSEELEPGEARDPSEKGLSRSPLVLALVRGGSCGMVGSIVRLCSVVWWRKRLLGNWGAMGTPIGSCACGASKITWCWREVSFKVGDCGWADDVETWAFYSEWHKQIQEVQDNKMQTRCFGFQ